MTRLSLRVRGRAADFGQDAAHPHGGCFSARRGGRVLPVGAGRDEAHEWNPHVLLTDSGAISTSPVEATTRAATLLPVTIQNFAAALPTHSSVDHTTAWITLAGALGVAVIAAVTAQWRLHVQLRNERHAADRAELRTLLDECAQTVGAATQNALLFGTLADELFGRSPLESVRRIVVGIRSRKTRRWPFPADRFDDAWNLLLQDREAMMRLTQRVSLRLGSDHPVSVAIAGIDDVLAALGEVDAILSAPRGPSRDAVIHEHVRQLRAKNDAFYDAARGVIGYRRW